jgi:hypothetical protein
MVMNDKLGYICEETAVTFLTLSALDWRNCGKPRIPSEEKLLKRGPPE